jgi:hypothetical protein
MPRGKKKVEKVEEVVKEAAESTATRVISPEEQSVMEEQNRQKRVAECTNAVRQALQAYNCDLDVSIILRAGQVIPRIAIVPVEVLQAQQRAPQNQPV